jgi:DNA-binding GntR family transcriptional regulator
MGAMTGSRASGPRYSQLAAMIRARIIAGEWSAGARIPSGPELTQIYGVSKTTAERAVMILEQEGMLQRRVGVGTFVTGAHAAAVIEVGRGTRITARMQPEGEGLHGMPPGVPVLVVEEPDGPARTYAADRTVIIVSGG